jgi:hypothetical protein
MVEERLILVMVKYRLIETVSFTNLGANRHQIAALCADSKRKRLSLLYGQLVPKRINMGSLPLTPVPLRSLPLPPLPWAHDGGQVNRRFTGQRGMKQYSLNFGKHSHMHCSSNGRVPTSAIQWPIVLASLLLCGQISLRNRLRGETLRWHEFVLFCKSVLRNRSHVPVGFATSA